MCKNCKDEWQDLRRQLFTPEENAASDRRVKAILKEYAREEKAEAAKKSIAAIKPKSTRTKKVLTPA